MIVQFILAVVIWFVIVVIRTYLVAPNFWAKKGIPTLKPRPVLGNIPLWSMFSKSLSQLHLQACQQIPNSPLIGFYTFGRADLLVQDPSLIEQLFTKDFAHFSCRHPTTTKPELEQNLFVLNGPQWKSLRAQLSPIFTTEKLKLLFPLMLTCSQELVKSLGADKANLNKSVEAYCLHIIGSTVFSISSEEALDSNSNYRQKSDLIFKNSLSKYINYFVVGNFPELANALDLTVIPNHVFNYFLHLTLKESKLRKSSSVKKTDVLQMLLDLQEQGEISVQNWEPQDEILRVENADQIKRMELTTECLIAQILAFFSAGVETSINTILFGLHELAKNPQVTKKLKKDISKSLSKHKGQWSYEAIEDMKYLDYCVKETLRLYPPVASIYRLCTRRYTFENEKLTIPAGTAVFVPTLAVHLNPSIHSEPTKFMPERWDPQIEKKRHQYSFLPFGGGPRMCIAMNFALLQLKLGLGSLVRHFNFSVDSKDMIELDSSSFVTAPKHPLNIKFTPE